MELDAALRFTAILAWDDVMSKAIQQGSVRVEYQGKSGSSLDRVSIWHAKAWGYHDLVCDYWTSASPTHPIGASFKNGHSSDKLAETLGFIMKNQDQFTRPADAGDHGLILIDPPTAEERRDAAAWIKQIRGNTSSFSSAA
jgi:hypothetical protein